MKKVIKKHFPNHLSQIRQTMQFEQKQVASLLGHKTTETISRYERGLKAPSLKTALKLAQIYNLPVRVMLDEYYETCWDEIRRQEARFSVTGAKAGSNDEHSSSIDFCTFEDKLASTSVEPSDLTKIRRHSTQLIRKTAEKLGQL